MELILFRKYLGETYTIGKLTNGDVYLCDTLEDKVRDLQDYNHDGDFNDQEEGKVYGETAIPAGRYKILFVYSPKFKRWLPYLSDVPGFKGILIHAGNSIKDTLGCILVGENKIKGGVINSRYHETIICQLISKAIENKEEVYITIKQ
jgi:hypothetical protein